MPRSNGRGSSSRKHSKDELPDYSVRDPAEISEGPDVLVNAPVVKVDEIELDVDDLHAQVAVMAQVRKLVNISVGADVRLGEVELKIEGVEAQAMLKARLDNVTAILERVLTTLDRNPELLRSVGRSIEQVGGGTGKMLDESGDAVEDVGQGAGGALQEIGQGAGQGVGQLGQGASQGLQGVGQGAARGVEGAGKGVQQAAGELGGKGGGQQGGGG